MVQKIIFLSSNEYKIKEVKEILTSPQIQISDVNYKIEELQTEDALRLVRDKTLKAFHEIGRPLFVEHTGLYINYLNGFPAGLTQIFWDKLEAEKFANLVGKFEDTSLTAKTVIGFCDGKEFYSFEGEIKGHVPEMPRGNIAFQWDCVFIPDGHKKTFAEMGEEKNKISMRKIALEKLREHLETHG